ncbi:MAG TPA: hypothetical protein VHE35_33650 [Kofleriaceae bacterium]|nr:hypothetical protein [Kofleriaceae bacterium]
MSSPSSAATVEVAALLQLSFDRVPSARTVEVGVPAGMGAIELPGARTRPVRPHLEASVSAAGIAARVVDGDGVAAPVIVLGDGAVVPVAAPPVAVAARADGAWVLYRDRLVEVGRDGSERRRIAASAVAMVPAGDAVWLADNDRAWRIDADGSAGAPQPWSHPMLSFAIGDELCARDAGDPSSVRCLAAEGARSRRPLPAVMVDATSVRIGARPWVIQAAGLEPSGRAFVVTVEGGEATIWRGAAGATAAAASSPVAAALRVVRPGDGAIGAAAVDGDDVLLYSQGLALEQRGGAAAKPTEVDGARYTDELFPRLWELASARGVVADGDGVVVSASGPTGMVLLRVRVP